MLGRKKCRALTCPRRVADDALFCNVHLRQLTPALLQPIATNREPGKNALPSEIERIHGGVATAVAAIAKAEGIARVLVEATNAGTSEPGQGGDGGGGGDNDTGRLEPPGRQDRQFLQ